MQLSTTILSIFRTEYNLFKSICTINKRIFCHFFKYKRKKNTVRNAVLRKTGKDTARSTFSRASVMQRQDIYH